MSTEKMCAAAPLSKGLWRRTAHRRVPRGTCECRWRRTRRPEPSQPQRPRTSRTPARTSTGIAAREWRDLQSVSRVARRDKAGGQQLDRWVAYFAAGCRRKGLDRRNGHESLRMNRMWCGARRYRQEAMRVSVVPSIQTASAFVASRTPRTGTMRGVATEDCRRGERVPRRTGTRASPSGRLEVVLREMGT